MTTNARGVLQAARWHRREFLLALGAVGALAGCGGGGGDGVELLPAGTKLLDLKFVDAQTAYGVGKEGLIARTDDGGQTWRRLPSESTTDMISVLPVNRQLVFVCGVDETVLRTLDGGARWQTIRQGDGTVFGTPALVFATDAEHVALRAEGGGGRWVYPDRLKITVDGGREWKVMSRPDSIIPWAPRFTPSGFLFSLYGPFSGEAQALWVSDDFGGSFRQTPLSGVAVGSFGDHGIWVQIPAGGAADQPGRVAVSHDAFRTWTEAPMQIDGFAVDAQPRIWMTFLDAAGLGWARPAWPDNGLLHTTDGGRRWTAAAVAAAPIDGRTLVMARDGAQWLSTDAGATWRPFDGVSSRFERDAAGALLARSWLLEGAGYSWQRSTDDGRTWRTLL